MGVAASVGCGVRALVMGGSRVLARDGLRRSSQKPIGPLVLFAILVAVLAFPSIAGADFSTTEGQSFTQALATIKCGPSSVTIDWGDGTPSSPGTFTGNVDGGSVQGTHTYAEEGTYHGSVSYQCDNGAPPVPFTATVQDASLTGVGRDFSGTAGQSVTALVSHITDFNPGGTANDFSAQIAWGDGTTTGGSVTSAAGGGFNVIGTHTYNSAGSYPVNSSITDIGGSSTSATSTAQIGTAAPPPPPSAVTGVASNVTQTSAQLNGTSNPNNVATTYHFDYGTSPSYGTSVPVPDAALGSDNTVHSVSQTIGGLIAGTTYHFRIVATSAGGTTYGSDQVIASPGPPTLSPSSPSVGSSQAAFSGVVNPKGLPTTARFEYGLDPKYDGGGPLAYDKSTPSTAVGSGFVNTPVSASVTGLLPNAVYHVRLVATNAQGTATGPDQIFTTTKAPAPRPPVLNKTENLIPVSGLVFVKPPPGKTLQGVLAAVAGVVKGNGFVPLTQARQVPLGSQIDSRAGTLDIVVASGRKSLTQKARLSGAVFTTSQVGGGIQKGLTTFALKDSAFSGAPSYKSCSAKRASAGSYGGAHTAKLSPKVLQALHATDNSGRFRTRGKYSAATVRGTIWDTVDRCDGTLTVVRRGSVGVFDFGLRKTITLRAPHSYLALAAR